jgi:hypothetical protein
MGRFLAREKGFLGIALVCSGLIASDFFAPENRFWSAHQMTTGIITGGALALIAVAGLDRLAASREARRWRPLSLMVIGRIEVHLVGFEETLFVRTMEFCKRTFGRAEVPEGRDYFEVLPEALEDPESWAPVEELPSLMEELESQLTESQAEFEIWAPILIADPRLATIGSLAIARHEAERNALVILEFLLAVFAYGSSERQATRAPQLMSNLVVVLIEHRRIVDELRRLLSEFRTR